MNQSIAQYLNSGLQTKITPEIKRTANSFNKKEFDLVFEILAWLHKNLRVKDKPEIKDKLFRKRTAQEIIKSGFITGCTDC